MTAIAPRSSRRAPSWPTSTALAWSARRLIPTRQASLSDQLFAGGDILARADSEQRLEFEIGGETYLARVRAMPAYTGGDQPSGIVALTNLTEATSPLKNPSTNLWFAAGIIFLLGAVALLLFIQFFLRPIERLESNIQEVVAGNKDLVFEYRGSNKLAQGLAHQLNLMSAVLQGKPTLDEDGGGSWNDVSTEGGPARVQGVNMSDLMGSKDDSDEQL